MQSAEDLALRVEYLEQERRILIDDALRDLRVHVGKGLGVDPEDLPGIEASVISLAVEALALRHRQVEAARLTRKLLARPNSTLTSDECDDLAKLADLLLGAGVL